MNESASNSAATRMSKADPPAAIGQPTFAGPTQTGDQDSNKRALLRVFAGLAGLCAAIGAAYAVPALASVRPWVPGDSYVPFWNIIGRELMGEGKVLEAEAKALEKLQAKLQAQPGGDYTADEPPQKRPAAHPVALGDTFPPYPSDKRVEAPAFGIEPPEALDHFYSKLALADLGIEGAIARAGHWGDSVLAIDGITFAIRHRLQNRFGDAGHGFHMTDRYDPGYRQRGVVFIPGGGWRNCIVVQQCSRDWPQYGYGGLISRSGGGGVSTWQTTTKGTGQVVSRFELWFGYQTRGGRVEIKVDDAPGIIVSTQGEERQDGWKTVNVNPGAHTFRVKQAGGGDVRLYGVVLENEGPGVVWDGMGLIGGSTRGLRSQDPEHIARQIQHRRLDMIVFLFGGNDMERGYVDLKDSMQPYYDEYGEVIRNFRARRPQAACLVMSMTDRGERTSYGTIVSRKYAKVLSKAQREVARRNGCGFFDTYEATGGEGSIAQWYRANPPLISPDLGHPSAAGHDLIGSLLTHAILHGYQMYRDRMVGKPLPKPEKLENVEDIGRESNEDDDTQGGGAGSEGEKR